MSHQANQDPAFAPLGRGRAEELELFINDAARSRSVLTIDPDQGVQGVRPSGEVAPEDGLYGVREFTRHFGDCPV